MKKIKWKWNSLSLTTVNPEIRLSKPYNVLGISLGLMECKKPFAQAKMISYVFCSTGVLIQPSWRASSKGRGLRKETNLCNVTMIVIVHSGTGPPVVRKL